MLRPSCCQVLGGVLGEAGVSVLCVFSGAVVSRLFVIGWLAGLVVASLFFRVGVAAVVAVLGGAAVLVCAAAVNKPTLRFFCREVHASCFVFAVAVSFTAGVGAGGAGAAAPELRDLAGCALAELLLARGVLEPADSPVASFRSMRVHTGVMRVAARRSATGRCVVSLQARSAVRGASAMRQCEIFSFTWRPPAEMKRYERLRDVISRGGGETREFDCHWTICLACGPFQPCKISDS